MQKLWTKKPPRARRTIQNKKTLEKITSFFDFGTNKVQKSSAKKQLPDCIRIDRFFGCRGLFYQNFLHWIALVL